MQIKRMPISVLLPDPSNERRHGEKNINAIKGSLKQWGQVEPLILNKRTGLLIGGHGRVEAMKSLGMTEVDVVEVDLDNTQAAGLRNALNRTGELAEWDMKALGSTLHGLREDGFDLNEIGFDVSDLDAILGDSDIKIPSEAKGSTTDGDKVMCPACDHEFVV